MLHRPKYYFNALIRQIYLFRYLSTTFFCRIYALRMTMPQYFCPSGLQKMKGHPEKCSIHRVFLSRNIYIWRNNQRTSLQTENLLTAVSARGKCKQDWNTLSAVWWCGRDGCDTGCDTLPRTDLNSRACSLHQLLHDEFHYGKAGCKAGYPSSPANSSSHLLSMQGMLQSICLGLFSITYH